MEMGMDSSAVQSGHELSASTFSSPLYSSQSVDEGASSAGATERNKYAENGTLMDLIRMRSARGKNGHNQTSPNVMETAPPAAQNGAAATPRGEATGKVDPYASYKDNVTFGATSEGDDENVYEPVEAPESNFDNPDYEAL